MGAPRRNRRKFAKPKDIWNLQRINSDNALRAAYGLKNMKELWKAQSNLSRIRGNVRLLLSGNAPNQQMEPNIISSLSRYGIVGGGAKLDDVLDLNVNIFLDRRLQSVVFKKGLARTIKQSRQLITHGFIAIGGKKVSRPGYMVAAAEEQQIAYYKQVDINAGAQAPKQAGGANAQAEGEEEEAAGGPGAAGTPEIKGAGETGE